MRLDLVSLACSVAWLISEPSSAQTLTKHEQRLTFVETLNVVAEHPAVRAHDTVARSLDTAARDRPLLDEHPTLSLAAGSRLRPSDERGLEFQAQLSQSLSLTGAIEHQAASLRAEAIQQRAASQSFMFDRKERAAELWIELWLAQQHVTSALALSKMACQTAALVTRLAEAGEETAADSSRARIECLRAESRVTEVEGEVPIAQLRLLELLGLDSHALEASGPLPAFASETAKEKDAGQLASRLPEVAEHLARAAVAKQRAQEAVAVLGPRVVVGAQLQRDAVGATSVLGLLSVPLPIATPAFRERATHAQVEHLERSQARIASARGKAKIRAAFHEVVHWRELALELDSVSPSADHLVRSRARQFETGEASLLELLDAQKQFAELNWDRDRARAFKALAEAKLALLLGQPTTASGPSEERP
jgi:outer membrane protein TolC